MMKKTKACCFVLILQLVFISMPAFAALDYVEYLSQASNNTGGFIEPNSALGQTFTTPSNCSYIDYIELQIDHNQWSTSEPLTLTLYTSTARTANVASATLYGSNALNYPKFYLKTTVTPNTTYYMELTHGGGGDNSVGWVCANNANPYAGGCMYTRSTILTPQTGYDLYFRVWGYQNDFLITAFYPPTPATYTTATQYDYMRDANFNCVQICEAKNQTENNTILDLCASRGIMVINCDADYYYGGLGDALNLYKNHSANGGFFIVDEPSATLFSDYAYLYNMSLAAASTKIPHVNLFPVYATDTQLGVSAINCLSQTSEGSGYYVTPNASAGQSFDAPADCTYIKYIELMIDYNSWSASEPLTLTLYTSASKITKIGQATLYGSNAGLYPKFYLETSVSPSASYYMELSHGGGGDNSVGWVVVATTNPYSEGCAYTNGTQQLSSDLYFKICRGRSLKDKSINQTAGGTGLPVSSTQRLGQTFKTPSTLERRLQFIELHIDQNTWSMNESLIMTIYGSPSKHQVLGSATMPGQCITSLSQTNLSGSFGYTLVPNSCNVGQTFDAPSDCSYIESVEFYVDDYYWSTSEPITLKLYTSTARTTLLKSVTLNGSNGGHCPKFYLETSVTPGGSYYMELCHGGGGDNSMGWVYTSTTNPYSEGCACTSNGTTVTQHVANDLYFKIYRPQPAPVYPRFYLNADLKPDTTYFFELTHDGGGNNSVGNVCKSSSNVYSDGTAYINGSTTTGDFYFRTVYSSLYQDYVNEWVDAVGAASLKYLSFDIYPFLSDGGMEATYFLNLELVRDIGVKNNVKLASYIQSCGYNGHRVPSENDLRYNVYTNLAYGVKELQWFCYFTPPGGTSANITNALINSDGTKSNLYTPAQTLNGEVKKLGPTLAALRSQAVYHNGARTDGAQGLPNDFWWQTGSANDNVIISYFKNHDGRKYILAVNRSVTDSATYYFTVNPAPSTVKEISKSTGAEVNTNYNSGQLSGSFLPGEGKLYALPAGY